MSAPAEGLARITFCASQEERRLWERLARSEGESLSEFIREALGERSKRLLLRDALRGSESPAVEPEGSATVR